ncbi:MAG TPA: hypothetical protein VM692_16300 [Gammaproteobacteria bacterium]|nr:hypothetical protein [Gammaproteobacteria bacterium]
MRCRYRAVTLALIVVAGCSRPDASRTSPAITDGWLGRWTGPEGTFLLLEGGNGRYDVTIQNLDGPRVFVGSSMGDQIRFERDGVIESIHATDGAATGMKWLAEKSNCLTVRPGEGYCRD